jgi:type IV pilus assembly protein PilN
MIRINLLPQKKESQKESGQAWVGVLMGVLFLEAVALFFLHQSKTNELAQHRRVNAELSSQISEIQKTVANHQSVKQQLAVFKQREDAIAKLQGARSGPTNILLELTRVLSPGRGPTVDADRLAQLRKDNPLAVPNPSWDTHRLWLLNYKEVERTVTIEGLARDGEDVSELARRLSLSNYFIDVKILPASRFSEGVSKDKVELLKFQLQARVKY